MKGWVKEPAISLTATLAKSVLKSVVLLLVEASFALLILNFKVALILLFLPLPDRSSLLQVVGFLKIKIFSVVAGTATSHGIGTRI